MYLHRAFFLTLGLIFLVGFSMTVSDINKNGGLASVKTSIKSQTINTLTPNTLDLTPEVVKPLSVTSVTIVNSAGLDIRNLGLGGNNVTNIDKKRFGSDISIKAFPYSEEVKSVEFHLQKSDGTFYEKIENTQPFTLFGDNLKTVNTWPKTFTDGYYGLVITPYSETNGQLGNGQAGESINLRLQLIK
jgi:hypothetical protein